MYRSLLWIVLLGWIAISCGADQQREHVVLRYNQPNHITSLDPAFAKSQNNMWGVLHLFDGLVALDESLNVVPAIAKSWDISEDGLTYTFHLRDDVLFHDKPCMQHQDRKVTAQDFVYSFNRLLDPEVSSPGSWLFADRVDEHQPFSAKDQHTFVLRLRAPFLPMLGILTMQYCSVVPRSCVEASEDFGQNPVGTGAFQFKRWIANQALFLNRYDDYYQGASDLEGIKTTFISDKKMAMLELLNGNTDFVSGLESSFVNEMLDKNGNLLAKHHDKLRLSKAPFLNMEYLGINLNACPKDSPLHDVRVRQAINYALDKQIMLTALRNNVGQPANSGFVPSGLPSHDPAAVPGYSYNLQIARELMAEAGYADNKEIPQVELYTNKDYVDITTFVARQLEKIGMDISIEVLESAILRDGMRKGTIPFFRASWIADYPDAESFHCMFYSKNPAPPNYTRYSNPEFDVLYDQAIKETDTDKRIALYQQMDRMIVADAPVVFLFYDEAARFHNVQLSNVSDNALNLLQAHQLELKID